MTFFFKTAFTPVGMNVYCRNAEGTPPQLTRRIREELLEMEDCRTGRSRMGALSYYKRPYSLIIYTKWADKDKTGEKVS